MLDFTRSSIRCGLAATALPLMLLGQAGAAHADQLPFPKQGYSFVGGPAAPGEVVNLTVKERPGNPHPTDVEVSSPALTDDTVLGDTRRAWVGAGRIKKTVKPGTYPVTFTLRHKSAECVTEEDRDYVCDYPAIVLRSKVTVSGSGRDRGIERRARLRWRIGNRYRVGRRGDTGGGRGTAAPSPPPSSVLTLGGTPGARFSASSCRSSRCDPVLTRIPDTDVGQYARPRGE